MLLISISRDRTTFIFSLFLYLKKKLIFLESFRDLAALDERKGVSVGQGGGCGGRSLKCIGFTMQDSGMRKKANGRGISKQRFISMEGSNIPCHINLSSYTI